MSKLSAVLLIDDDPATNHLNERLLRRLDLADHYLLASDGAAALRQLQQLAAAQPLPGRVLVLLDLLMPGMDGMGFAAAVRQLPAAVQGALVILVHTLNMNSHDLGRLDSLPIAGLVSKPLTEEKLATVLQLHFGH
ncbi:Response regulator receiver domain-containing protein [Hymenobacter daecheongensis DSM 21074]|uniref:Response regulator receiver domain-containing protein n=1 Tax=Hymenobacter daecheongensis DSM 21074 TaxID=1121955 RepID=A0A1M6MQP2_9BACT|nr:response regulator [Hymenobacter daecheongensis]SHJ85791.1 Response regulator receiver domain-containing protein [Hymenobacter daecheongensis DSM 21074]